MKIFTSNGRKIKRQVSTYDRFILLQVQLGMTHREARRDWKLFIINLGSKAEQYFNTQN